MSIVEKFFFIDFWLFGWEIDEMFKKVLIYYVFKEIYCFFLIKIGNICLKIVCMSIGFVF